MLFSVTNLLQAFHCHVFKLVQILHIKIVLAFPLLVGFKYRNCAGGSGQTETCMHEYMDLTYNMTCNGGTTILNGQCKLVLSTRIFTFLKDFKEAASQVINLVPEFTWELTIWSSSHTGNSLTGHIHLAAFPCLS